MVPGWYPKWLPGTQQALIAYHKYTEFTSPTTGISRQRIYKIAQTEPYTSFSILATLKEGYVLFYPGVLFDGTIVFQRWDGLETANRERVISNHILDV